MYEHASASCIVLVLAHVIIVPSFAYHAELRLLFHYLLMVVCMALSWLGEEVYGGLAWH